MRELSHYFSVQMFTEHTQRSLSFFLKLLMIVKKYKIQTFHLGWNEFEILNRSRPRNQLNWFKTWKNEPKMLKIIRLID